MIFDVEHIKRLLLNSAVEQSVTINDILTCGHLIMNTRISELSLDHFQSNIGILILQKRL